MRSLQTREPWYYIMPKKLQKSGLTIQDFTNIRKPDASSNASIDDVSVNAFLDRLEQKQLPDDTLRNYRATLTHYLRSINSGTSTPYRFDSQYLDNCVKATLLMREKALPHDDSIVKILFRKPDMAMDIIKAIADKPNPPAIADALLRLAEADLLTNESITTVTAQFAAHEEEKEREEKKEEDPFQVWTIADILDYLRSDGILNSKTESLTYENGTIAVRIAEKYAKLKQRNGSLTESDFINIVTKAKTNSQDVKEDEDSLERYFSTYPNNQKEIAIIYERFNKYIAVMTTVNPVTHYYLPSEKNTEAHIHWLSTWLASCTEKEEEDIITAWYKSLLEENSSIEENLDKTLLVECDDTNFPPCVPELAPDMIRSLVILKNNFSEKKDAIFEKLMKQLSSYYMNLVPLADTSVAAAKETAKNAYAMSLLCDTLKLLSDCTLSTEPNLNQIFQLLGNDPHLIRKMNSKLMIPGINKNLDQTKFKEILDEITKEMHQESHKLFHHRKSNSISSPSGSRRSSRTSTPASSPVSTPSSSPTSTPGISPTSTPRTPKRGGKT